MGALELRAGEMHAMFAADALNLQAQLPIAELDGATVGSFREGVAAQRQRLQGVDLPAAALCQVDQADRIQSGITKVAGRQADGELLGETTA